MTPRGLNPDNWNNRYQSEEYVYGKDPHPFLVTCRPRFTGRDVLCIADGEGRNGVWLAGEGFSVTSLDFSSVGLEKARKLAEEKGVSLQTVEADAVGWDYGTRTWDVLVSIFAHFPRATMEAVTRKWIRALRPGGHLLFVGYDQAQLGRDTGGPRSADLLYDLNQVQHLFASLTTVYLEKGEVLLREGSLHQGLGMIIRGLFRKEKDDDRS
ncbi:MAG: class I SAM-dependent methyltransferase [Candidatus Neomarinimicrobiota bacterium]|nr:MAG: class I SAM-dependent methyltransferase [Candidatus Neomarinimicrobiota bacterium]